MAALAASPSCRAVRDPAGTAAPVQPDPALPGAALQAEWLARHRGAYSLSMRRAREWLDTLHVDPAALRSRGIKGKKRLVELLDAYRRLWKVASEEARPQLLTRIREVVRVTYEPRYHDMLSIGDEWFKQDATSYLRAAVLMDRLGLDTRMYREEILRIHDRLNGHMKRRGPHQRRVFHWYYRHFGLEEPFPLQNALEAGVIARRKAPSGISGGQAYELTHEIYALFEYGDKLDTSPFSPEDVEYLHVVLPELTRRYVERNNPDLVAELVECQHYLRMHQDPSYRGAVEFLLAAQNGDGSWGSYGRQRQNLGEYVKLEFELHTTLVAIGALTAVFDSPMP
jgi:hypothetical protein